MDLIYTDKNRIEQGVLQNFEVDFDTTNNKDFQITVGIKNNVLQGGFWWYIEGTEYGGKVDGYEVLTETNEIRYTGRNFRGILESKVIEPPTGQDHKIVSGNMQDVVSGLIAEKSLQDIFVVDASDVVVSNHKINRYVTLYEGISAIATRYGLIPSFVVNDGKVHVSFRKPIDYSDANEYTQDDLNFSIKRSFSDVNHLICLGQGELKDRTVVHLYADAEGNVSDTQSLFGIDEVVAVYENTNAEDANILKTEGIEKLNELKNTDSFEVTIPDIDLQIGDIIGGIERVTNTYVARQIVNVIAKITDIRIDLEYKVGEDSARSKSSGSSSGSSGGGGGGSSFNLSPATANTLGGVMIGDGINVDASGKISVTVTKGEKGEAGADGYSPTVTTSKSGKTTTITITDKNGTKTTTINDGEDGVDGKDGVSVSSIVQTTTSTADGGTNVITATLSDGTKTTFNIKNGSQGSKGDRGEAGKDGINAASEFEGYEPSDFANANHTHSSYVNQNAFSNVKVGSTTIAADTTTDTLTITAGDNVTITPDATNDKVTIAATHPTITKSTDSTSTAAPSAGGTFTTIDSVTRDSNGHVTKVNTKTVTLPNTNVTVDSALSSTSTNPVQNKVVNEALNSLDNAHFKDRGWVTNGAALSSLLTGVYSTNPNNLPSVSVPDGYSPYGSLIVANDNYTSFIYNDVYGNLGSYNTNQGGWTKYYSQTSVETLVNNSKVKSITIEDAVVTSNTIGSTSPFYGTGYTYYGCTAGNSRTTIDNLISQGHTILGGFISRGACNDGEFANNIAALTAMVVNYNTYARCPYQIVFVSNGYQTIHCYVTILYI